MEEETSKSPNFFKRSSFCILLVGAFMLIFRIGYHALWLDEATSVRRVSYEFSFMLQNIAANDAHPPGYYLIAWILGFLNQLLPIETAIRLPSAICAWVMLIYTIKTEKKLFPKVNISQAGIFLCFSSFFIYFGQEARHYIAFSMFSTIASYYLLALIKDGFNVKDACLYIFALTASFYTFYYTLFIAIAHFIILLFSWKTIKKDLLKWASIFVIPGILFSFYVPTIIKMKNKLEQNEANMNFRFATPGELQECLREILAGYQFYSSVWTGLSILSLCIIGIILFLIFSKFRKQKNIENIYILLLFFIPILCISLFPLKPHIVESKHLIFLLFPIALLFSSSLNLSEKWPIISRFFLVVLILTNLMTLTRYWSQTGTKEAWNYSVDMIYKEIEPGDIFFTAPFYLEYPLEIYLDKKAINNPIYHIFQYRFEPEKKDFILSKIKQAPRIWLIELKDSPVSFHDTESLRIVLKDHTLTKPVELKAKNGTIKITLLMAKPSNN
ncbi:MAG: glycosyltransferase family 39 protein [Lentisphaeria bacterium]|nr:glycosyltransferase family 39 protein [Lentisphaeria bacterium]